MAAKNQTPPRKTPSTPSKTTPTAGDATAQPDPPWKLPPCSGPVFRNRYVAPLRTLVAVGFGYAAIIRDNQQVYCESPETPPTRWRRLRSFESQARKNPHHDWRLILHDPFHSREYQRHGRNLWVLVKSGPGFA